MALRTAPWHNADGLDVKFGNFYGNRANFVNRPYIVNRLGSIKEVRIEYDLSKLAASEVAYTSDATNDGTLDSFNTGDFYFPANASVLNGYIVVTEAAAGGTSIKLGTYQLDGTAIDDDFVITATEGAKANIDSVGSRTYANGAGVAATAETAGVGTVDAYLALSAQGTFTAGKGSIFVTYFDPLGDA